MIPFEKYQLDNGLTVILQPDETTPIVAVDICYLVGSRDENPNKTGLAHLFEHLMFGGSKNVLNFDTVLQKAGGENNAFTTVDYTNYYLSLPLKNIETAFYLESDRMNELAFLQTILDIQKNVVVEEFKQSYLNQPYGDLLFLLKDLAYKVHPYQWNPIGKSPDHIKSVTMNDVKEFFYTFYRPNNAVLSIAGDIHKFDCKDLVNKWFGYIPKGNVYERNLPVEPTQSEARFLEVFRNVPCDCLCKAYKMGKRTDNDFISIDLVSDILSNGQSSRLQQKLVKSQQLFSSISSYTTGTLDNGLFIIIGYLNNGVEITQADMALMEVLNELKTTKISEYELEKVKNKAETALVSSEISVQDKAMQLALYETIGQAEDLNLETNKYRAVSQDDILKACSKLFKAEQSSTIYYKAKK